MRLTSTKLLNLIALLSFAAVGLALISQHVFDMRPCGWCVLQRLVFITLGLVCWLGAQAGVRAPSLQRVASVAAIVLSFAGIAAAIYQLRVANHLFSCSQTFADRYMTSSGLESSLPWLFGIYASCMDARVELLGIEYAWWSLALFAVCAAMATVAAIRR